MDFPINCYYSQTERSAPYTAHMHSHEQYEIYYLLEGIAQYCVEGRRYDLTPGDIVLMRKGEVHFAEVNGQETYRRIVVNFDILPNHIFHSEDLLAPFLQRPAGKFNHYPSHLFPDNHWEFYLMQIHGQTDNNARFCYLIPLLCELQRQFITLQHADLTAKKDPAAPIMKYINTHLTEPLSLELLSRQFYTSQTHLNRLFRKSAGTTVWEYITVKRLFMAKDLLEKGTPATEVYSDCGFADYSTFFRAYKRRFGVAPSAHSVKQQNTPH